MSFGLGVLDLFVKAQIGRIDVVKVVRIDTVCFGIWALPRGMHLMGSQQS
jgi:hypothetical protein